MSGPAKAVYDSLSTFKDLENLVDNGESENVVLECKNHEIPKINDSLRINLAKNISGFSNSIGGTLIIGASTDNRKHSGLDMITEIIRIGNCETLSNAIKTKIPTLTYPSVTNFEIKAIKTSSTSKKGVVILYIPQTTSDPIQSIVDNYFWLRSGDTTVRMEYEMIKRVFLATESPELDLSLENNIKKNQQGEWEIPLFIMNKTSAAARDVVILTRILNVGDCSSIIIDQFDDASELNPGQKIFVRNLVGVVHRKLTTKIGKLRVIMKGGKNPKRTLRIKIDFWADKMRASTHQYKLSLSQKNFKWNLESEDYLY